MTQQDDLFAAVASRPDAAVGPLDHDTKKILQKTALTIRGLAMDAVQKADSGHPGLPMGCAEIGAYLWGVALRYNPRDPKWLGRDRFILSAGHGSIWLYSCLHLAGYDLTMQDIESFRQLHSKTPGHPESLDTPGVETTTGPLGQGVGNAVGQALGLKMLQQRFGGAEYKLFDAKVYCLMSDGCMMEGIASEASSLAGHLQLDNLIMIYDSNRISLDGPLDDSASENTKARYEAYGWETYEVDGHDLDALHAVLGKLRHKQQKPAFIVAHTIIGKGSPHKSGSNKSHGSPLGADEVKASKELLGLPQDPFWVPGDVGSFFKERAQEGIQRQETWQKDFSAWAKKNPESLSTFEKMQRHYLPEDLEKQISAIELPASLAGREASHKVLQKLAELLPQLVGGSADLSSSDKTLLDKYPIVRAHDYQGRNIKYGVREFAMAAMATGLAQTQLLQPYVGTFLTFSDYMRNAIRLAALMREKVIYQFTHDSIFLGEDGPTHQPVEHYAALRAIPRLQVLRPADANEVKMSWIAALQYRGPTAIILSRQGLPTLRETELPYSQGVGRGAYILRRGARPTPDYTLLATGSEVSLALDVAEALEKMGKAVRVISMPCWEIFEQQDAQYKEELLGGDLGQRVSIEAGVSQGWHKYIGRHGIAISQDDFGASAPYRALKEHFGFTVESILDRII